MRAAAPSRPSLLLQRWCSREDSNLHGLPHTVLSRTRLPIPPRELWLPQPPVFRQRERHIMHPAKKRKEKVRGGQICFQRTFENPGMAPGTPRAPGKERRTLRSSWRPWRPWREPYLVGHRHALGSSACPAINSAHRLRGLQEGVRYQARVGRTGANPSEGCWHALRVQTRVTCGFGRLSSSAPRRFSKSPAFCGPGCSKLCSLAP